MTTLLETIDHSLKQRPEAIAFQYQGERLRWGELDQAAHALVDELDSQGLHPGDRIACGLSAGLELPVQLLAHLRAGLIHVPVNDRYRDAEIDHLFELTGPAACVGLARRPSPTQAHGVPDDAALILSTSGTTGQPKGVLHTHRSLQAGIGSLTRLWSWSPTDRQVLALPLFHIHGLGIGLLGALMCGVTTELLPRFDAALVCDAMNKGGTVFMGVPTMYVALVEYFETHPEAARSFSNARLCCAGSSALSSDTLRRFEEYTGQRILERYGMSETLITVSNPLNEERREGAIGHPIPGVEVHIEGDSEGELWVRGDTLMHSYWQDPKATSEAMTQGWFRTGDRVRKDDDGYLHHQGRLSVDWIKSGGWRVGARELEVLLEAHPLVREAAVFGVPDSRWGELVAAAVVLNRPLDDADQVLADFIRPQVADYKVIRRWVVVEALPRNALGKVQKRRLLDQI